MQKIHRLKNSCHEYGTENAGLTIVISRVLQAGVILSSVVIGSGVILSFLHPNSQQINTQLPSNLIQMMSGLLILQPQAVIFLGLLILIATPVIRVAISIIAFAVEHDSAFVVISCIVMMILLVSFMLGKGGA
jgi:uncharacterized membrane protein